MGTGRLGDDLVRIQMPPQRRAQLSRFLSAAVRFKVVNGMADGRWGGRGQGGFLRLVKKKGLAKSWNSDKQIYLTKKKHTKKT